MTKLAEIEAAVAALPKPQKRKLLAKLAAQLQRPRARAKSRCGLKAASYPAVEGLPSDLSVGTRDRVRALIARQHGANR